MKSVALYGGSFNPPHAAHQLLALYVLETQAVDELWFVPTFVHAFDKPLAPFEDRLAMCERAVAALGPRAKVSAVERDVGGKSRTLLTVRHLLTVEPDLRLSLVIGADLVGEIDGWYGADELRQLVSLIVVGRQGVEPGPASSLPVAPLAMPEISSTRIRHALAAGESIDGLVPRAVLSYIHERGLYGAGSPSQQKR